jgi:hypothetical protein
MLTRYHAQVWKRSELARSLGASEPTMRKYLDILSSTFMVFVIHVCHAEPLAKMRTVNARGVNTPLSGPRSER